MESNEPKPTREPSHNPGFIRAAVIIALAVVVAIVFVKAVVGVKIGVFGL
jgi:hypothetical protein